MIKNSRIEISPVMFENEFRKRKLTLTKASLKMGYSDNYLSVCKDRGYLTRPAMVLLEQLFGIKEEDISVTNAVGAVTGNTEPAIDHIKLYNTIYSAVYNAMADALNGEKKHDSEENDDN